MKKEYRIKKNEEIENVLKTGIKKYTKTFIGYKIDDNKRGHFRYAISVGKKIGDAHVRNRVKRQLRSIVDNMVDITQEKDIFIIVKTNVLSLDYNEMKSDVNLLFNYLNIKEKINENN